LFPDRKNTSPLWKGLLILDTVQTANQKHNSFEKDRSYKAIENEFERTQKPQPV